MPTPRPCPSTHFHYSKSSTTTAAVPAAVHHTVPVAHHTALPVRALDGSPYLKAALHLAADYFHKDPPHAPHAAFPGNGYAAVGLDFQSAAVVGRRMEEGRRRLRGRFVRVGRGIDQVGEGIAVGLEAEEIADREAGGIGRIVHGFGAGIGLVVPGAGIVVGGMAGGWSRRNLGVGFRRTEAGLVVGNRRSLTIAGVEGHLRRVAAGRHRIGGFGRRMMVVSRGVAVGRAVIEGVSCRLRGKLR